MLSSHLQTLSIPWHHPFPQLYISFSPCLLPPSHLLCLRTVAHPLSPGSEDIRALVPSASGMGMGTVRL